MDLAQEKLNGMLKAAGLPVRPSYRRSEVCLILGVSERTFWRMVAAYDQELDGSPRLPWTLDSYMTRGHHRVRYQELVDFLARNRTITRKFDDPNQMDLPL
ncbi:helix-turn-helix domain-containing protein [Geoalkalibacter subterraneus]|jgi:hypothetical protein|uniref:Uncharacterized protein n=1 Tax=Geoalkalibacter subterraneus TaxID=483547 RepID=A0A0B5FSZ1_9BACT|nr:helix-turn-helix domain-containing protein [Geoalkalibacter subterraneus]AJF07779.1 hypothetical protein GSUB_16145 [Geoalkalibacter subterraneus]